MRGREEERERNHRKRVRVLRRAKAAWTSWPECRSRPWYAKWVLSWIQDY